MRIGFTAPEAGIVVLKDSYFPGWEATLNRTPTKVVRVDGMVRGVMVPRAGRYELEFVYRPRFFVLGLGLAVLIGLLGLSAVIYSAGFKHPGPPLWATLLGGTLLVALLTLSVQAYCGLSIAAQWRSLMKPWERPEAVVNAEALRVVYVPQAHGPLARDTRVPGESGEPSWPAVGDAVLTGSGQLVRLREDGWIRMVGVDGQRIRVVNVGAWERERGRLGGLEAVHRGGRWVIDDGAMTATNRNSDVREGTEREPIPGFWISPGGGGYVVRRMADASGPFVRVEATRAAAYLVLNGQGILGTLEGVPVSIRGQIRAHGRGKATLTLYDVVAADGTAKTYTTQASASEGWTTLVVRAHLEAARPDPRDNFSLGVFGVTPGDWFDIRELSLFVGTLP